MSRTYRKTIKGNKKCWIKPFLDYLKEKDINYRSIDHEMSRLYSIESAHYDWFYWNSKGPSSFINLYVNRPQRYKDSTDCRKIVNGYYDYDDGEFLNNKGSRECWD